MILLKWNRRIILNWMLRLNKNIFHKMHILILNGDLPVFPGWGGIEYLHTTRFARLAKKVGLVSVVQTREQDEKKIELSEAGVNLYLWTNPNLNSPCSPVHKNQNVIRQFSKNNLYIYSRLATSSTRYSYSRFSNVQYFRTTTRSPKEKPLECSDRNTKQLCSLA